MGSVAGNRQFVVPQPSLFRRFNPQIVMIAGLVLVGFGAMFAIWLRKTPDDLTLIRHDDSYEVNLKAMTSFDLDQVGGRLTDVPAKFRALEGKKVELIGEMWNPHRIDDDTLSYFQLVYSKT